MQETKKHLVNYAHALVKAIKEGDVAAVKKITQAKNFSVDAPIADQCTALYLASSDNQLSICKVLVDAGADVNGIPSQKYSPLFVALQLKHHPVALYLINQGADVRCRDKKSGLTGLHLAIQNDQSYIAKRMIEGKANVNTTAFDDLTPLFSAVLIRSHQCISLLLDADAAIEHVTMSGETALHLACQHGYSDIVLQLLTRGADIHKKNNEGIGVLGAIFESDFFDFQLSPILGRFGVKSDEIFSSIDVENHCNEDNKNLFFHLVIIPLFASYLSNQYSERAIELCKVIHQRHFLAINWRFICRLAFIHKCNEVTDWIGDEKLLSTDTIKALQKIIGRYESDSSDAIHRKMYKAISAQSIPGFMKIITSDEFPIESNVDLVKLINTAINCIQGGEIIGNPFYAMLIVLISLFDQKHTDNLDLQLGDAFINFMKFTEEDPLELATEKGYIKTVVGLMNIENVLINNARKNSYGLLKAAFKSGNFVLVSFLYYKLDMSDSIDQSPPSNNISKLFLQHLQNAIANNNDREFYSIMNLVPDRICQINNGANALLSAVKSGQLKYVHYLIEIGVDVNTIISMKNSSVLHEAFSLGHFEVAQILIDAGASLTHTNDEGRNALHMVTIAGHVHFLLDRLDSIKELDVPANMPGLTPLMVIIAKGDADTARKMVGKGANVSASTTAGSTLYIAAETFNPRDLQWLLDQGAKCLINHPGVGQFRPIHNAIVHNPEVIPCLIDAGADLFPDTSHHALIISESTDIPIRLLGQDDSVLTFACTMQKHKAVEMILASKKIDLKQDHLTSVYIEAFLHNSEQIIIALVHAGARIKRQIFIDYMKIIDALVPSMYSESKLPNEVKKKLNKRVELCQRFKQANQAFNVYCGEVISLGCQENVLDLMSGAESIDFALDYRLLAFFAAKYNAAEMLVAVHRKQPDTMSAPISGHANTVLHVALTHQHWDLIPTILNLDSATINTSNDQGDTPLMIALRSGAPICVIKALLTAGAELYINRVYCVKVLVKDGVQVTEEIQTLFKQHQSTLKIIARLNGCTTPHIRSSWQAENDQYTLSIQPGMSADTCIGVLRELNVEHNMTSTNQLCIITVEKKGATYLTEKTTREKCQRMLTEKLSPEKPTARFENPEKQQRKAQKKSTVELLQLMDCTEEWDKRAVWIKMGEPYNKNGKQDDSYYQAIECEFEEGRKNGKTRDQIIEANITTLNDLKMKRKKTAHKQKTSKGQQAMTSKKRQARKSTTRTTIDGPSNLGIKSNNNANKQNCTSRSSLSQLVNNESEQTYIDWTTPLKPKKNRHSSLALKGASSNFLFMEGLDTYDRNLNKDKREPIHDKIIDHNRWLCLFLFYNGIFDFDETRIVNHSFSNNRKKPLDSIFTADDGCIKEVRNNVIHTFPSKNSVLKNWRKCVKNNLGPKVKEYCDYQTVKKDIHLINIAECPMYKRKSKSFDVCSAIRDEFDSLTSFIDRLDSKTQMYQSLTLLRNHRIGKATIENDLNYTRVLIFTARAIEASLMLLGELAKHYTDQENHKKTLSKNVVSFLYQCRHEIRNPGAHESADNPDWHYSPLSVESIEKLEREGKKLHEEDASLNNLTKESKRSPLKYTSVTFTPSNKAEKPTLNIGDRENKAQGLVPTFLI